MRYEKYKGGRFWAVYNDLNQLVCICVYKTGAINTIRIILSLQGFNEEQIAKALLDADIAYKKGLIRYAS